MVTDGTRVLGLGDIGPEAALPVMEGKALLFKYLGGVDAFPICLRTQGPGEIVRNFAKRWNLLLAALILKTLKSQSVSTFLRRLRSKQVPVWHDDQQGTATVILAGLINAFKLVGKKPKESLITLVGSGAANIRTAYVLMKWGVNPGNIILADSKGVIYKGRADINQEEDPWKYDVTQKTQRQKGQQAT